MGHVGGLVVSMLAFNSDNLKFESTEVNNFPVKLLLKSNGNKQKDAGVGPLRK